MFPFPGAIAIALLCTAPSPSTTTPATTPPTAPPTAPLSLANAMSEARAKNPSLRAARARVKSAAASVESARRLPDPLVKGEIWGAPLSAPYALNKSDTLMLGVRQEFPLTSFVDAKRDAANAAVDVERADVGARMRDLEREVSAAFVRYRVTHEERALHLEHVRIMETTIDAMRAAQATGRASEADVSSAEVALTMAHGELFALDAEEGAARATLNAWMARDPAAPLGEPVDDAGDARGRDAGGARTPASSPEIARAQAEAAMASAEARAMRDDATLPTIMASVDYWYMPTARDPHGYGAMLGVSLPWLNFGRGGEIEAARRKSEAANAEAEAAALDVARMRAERTALVDARGRQLAAIEKGEIPAAQRNVEAAQSALASGGADARAVLAAEAMLLDARIRRVRTRAELDLARIDLASLETSADTTDTGDDDEGAAR